MSKPENKLPQLAIQDVKVEYPYYSVTSDTNGASVYSYVNPVKPWESYKVTLSHDGSFSSQQISQSYKGMSAELTHEKRNYVSGGESNHTDGNKDNNTKATLNENVAGDSAKSSGETEYKGSKKEVGGAKESSFAGIAGGKSWRYSDGDANDKIKGSLNSRVEGKRTETTLGCSLEMVKGDKLIYTEGGAQQYATKTKGIGIQGAEFVWVQSDFQIKHDVFDSPVLIELTKDKIEITGASDGVKIILTNNEITLKAPTITFDAGNINMKSTGSTNFSVGGSLNFTKT